MYSGAVMSKLARATTYMFNREVWAMMGTGAVAAVAASVVLVVAVRKRPRESGTELVGYTSTRVLSRQT